jgi:hypothetical protein
MGALFSSPPSIPAPPPPPPPVPPPPTPVDPAIAKASADVRSRAISAATIGGTIATGPQGLTTPASTAQKTLLGG